MQEVLNEGTPEEVAITGEVIYELLHQSLDKKTLKKFIHESVKEQLTGNGELIWASYLVIFSPGQTYDEVRCQLDVETNGSRSAFAVGYGHRPTHALSDALERIEWYDKGEALKIS